MSSPKKKTGKRSQGIGIRVGSTVRLSNLTSEKGRKLNDSNAKIVEDHREGRYAVQLLDDAGSKMKIQTLNLRVVCCSCYADQSKFQFCSKCQVAAYCDGDCQRKHWKTGGHKQSCCSKHEELDEGTGAWMKSKDHPSWKKLTQPQRQALRKYHLDNNCKEAWPISCETPAMLDPPSPCFLVNHPNMRFKVALEELPGGFTMQYEKVRDDANALNGKKAPLGRMISVVREDMRRGRAQFNAEEYFTQVPSHTPHQVIYAVIREVIWTKPDFLDFTDFYKTEPGKLFDWPGAECVPICPGTGEKVSYSRTEKHLLVACNLQGNVIRGSTLHGLTRIMPRILTIKGYEKMMGPSGDHRCVMIPKKESSVGTEKMEFYPTAFRLMKGNGVMTASQAYDEFHSSGLYKAFERLLDDEKANIASRVGNVGLNIRTTASGIGPSKYIFK